ncbi:MAG: mechanosensitive ion channel family protein [Candidatus Marinimicrobia bacterium]|nr:mechanosensitive ion channel family protein [Candidatus Neomarinimicrobiota bacterium]
MDLFLIYLDKHSSTLLLVASLLGFSLVIRYGFAPKILELFRRVKGVKISVELLYQPLSNLSIPVFSMFITPILSLPTQFNAVFQHMMQIWLIGALAWLLIRILVLFKELILGQYQLDAKDNLKARQISTQLLMIERVVNAVILLIAGSIILMSFDKAREIGFSLLASAGIAGIILGLAAQRSLATLFAGIQLAITQPIRIDDVVIVEHEWGWIEEITLTFVVVRIWDQRRLVLPITYFIEHPFQNWTRKRADLLGTVYLYVDYKMPLDDLRTELDRIVKESPLWDGRVAKIQVTNATEKSVELRALVSAENASNAWDLRCLVREDLLTYIQRHFPESLPRIRLDRGFPEQGESNV